VAQPSVIRPSSASRSSRMQQCTSCYSRRSQSQTTSSAPKIATHVVKQMSRARFSRRHCKTFSGPPIPDGLLACSGVESAVAAVVFQLPPEAAVIRPVGYEEVEGSPFLSAASSRMYMRTKV